MTQHEWLLEEYKILQSKIDTIGEDRFKVRAWSVTITLGLIIGEKLFDAIPPPALGLALASVVLFHMLEHRQRDLARRVGGRAREIERILRRLSRIGSEEKISLEKRADLLSLHSVPGI